MVTSLGLMGVAGALGYALTSQDCYSFPPCGDESMSSDVMISRFSDCGVLATTSAAGDD